MNRKLISIVLMLFLLGNTLFAVVSMGDLKSEKNIIIDDKYFEISDPVITDKSEYILVNLEEETSLFLETGKPIIPTITRTFTYPLGTEIVDVNVRSETKENKLEKKIQPSPSPVILSDSIDQSSLEIVPDENVYSSANLYPSDPYNVNIGVGLDNNEHVVIVNVQCYAQYSPVEDIIYVPTEINIEISHVPPIEPLLNLETYMMLIITDEKFSEQLQPLVDHKNNIGVKTILMTTQEIYPKYNGRDQAEDIKLCIKDAIEEYGIKFVLLAGGRKGQTFDWYIPDRRTNNDADMESGYSSDLYYSDIFEYRPGGYIFADWDTNDNGIFAEFYPNTQLAADIIDYYPDVYVGRIPLRYSWEADIIVDKIITYETETDDSWFKTAFVVGGDTSPPARDTAGIIKKGIYEGEIATDTSAKLLEDIGFSVERLWTSTGTWKNREDIIKAVSAGSGFIHFSGHGNPSTWVNFLPNAQTEQEKADGFDIFDMRKYSNGYKLPVVVVGGCHNAQFNVTMQYLFEGLDKYGAGFFYQPEFTHMVWIPTDTCSWFLLEGGGGAIGSIGCTGYGYGYINEYCSIGLGGWINPRFFYAYAKENTQTLGETHSQAIKDYINIIGHMNDDQIDRKTVEGWPLLGDPSLRLGGI